MRGLTLIEALFTLAIATIVGTLLLVVMVNTGGLFLKQSSKVALGLSLNDVLREIQKTIRQSSSVADTSGVQKLSLKVPSVDSSGAVIANSFDDFIFLLDQSKLVFRVLPNAQSSRIAADQILATNIDMLNFKYFDSQNPPSEVIPKDAKKIKTILALKQKAGFGFEQNIATAEANLRND